MPPMRLNTTTMFFFFKNTMAPVACLATGRVIPVSLPLVKSLVLKIAIMCSVLFGLTTENTLKDKLIIIDSHIFTFTIPWIANILAGPTLLKPLPLGFRPVLRQGSVVRTSPYTPSSVQRTKY